MCHYFLSDYTSVSPRSTVAVIHAPYKILGLQIVMYKVHHVHLLHRGGHRIKHVSALILWQPTHLL